MPYATALVLLMTPALAFFYGGLVRSKNILNTMMMSYASLGIVGVLWALVGYSLAFSPGNAWIGGLDYALLNGVGPFTAVEWDGQFTRFEQEIELTAGSTVDGNSSVLTGRTTLSPACQSISE